MKKLLAYLFCLPVLLFSQTPKQFTLGIIDEIQSVQLSEKRILNIYLPEGYDKNDTTHYPVIYLLDGGADEDFIHVVGLVQFNNFEWVNRTPKSIVVGIANVDRKRDFSYPTSVAEDKKAWPTTGGSEKFIAFVEKELHPYIEKTYKGTKTKTLIGQSFGGLLATEILFKKPTLFNTYIIVSPSLWWDDGSLLKLEPDILKEGFKQKTRIYLAVGNEGVGPGKKPHSMEKDVIQLHDMLKASKCQCLDMMFDYLTQENHGTILHRALLNAFDFLSPPKAKAK
jgi:predicted alpha/beta superfamily hydrolase